MIISIYIFICFQSFQKDIFPERIQKRYEKAIFSI